MKTKLLFIIGWSALTITIKSNALPIIEPDNYTNGTVLQNIFSQVTLYTADGNNSPMLFFPVTATRDPWGYAPTGSNVFANAGIYFWNDNWRLRMNFNTPADFVSIAFAGGDLFTNDTARLDAFNSSGSLIASYTSGPEPPGGVETLKVSRGQGDIAWAVAYLPPGGGSFGRFDHLQFDVVPEPSSAALFALCGTAWLVRKTVRRKN